MVEDVLATHPCRLKVLEARTLGVKKLTVDAVPDFGVVPAPTEHGNYTNCNLKSSSAHDRAGA